MCSRPALTARALLARLVLGGAAFWLLACSGDPSDGRERVFSTSQTGGASSGGASPEFTPEGAGGSDDILVDDLPTTCGPPEDALRMFSEQAVFFTKPFGRVLYSWTSAQQEEELRAGGPLLSVGEVPGLGKGIAMDRLTERAASPAATPLEVAITQKFTTFRYSWPHPWATRLGMAGEDYGDRLVRMKLAPHSWIARISSNTGGIDLVVDLFGEVIPLDQAEQSPERIAALYYENVATGRTDAPDCYFGTFTHFGGSGGYREFIVGNSDLVEEWSLGTDEILNRLRADILSLQNYLSLTRPCPSPIGSNFNAEVSCSWGRHQDAYFEALALPSELYIPRAAQLANLIDTLVASLFVVDPLVRRNDDDPPEQGSEPQPVPLPEAQPEPLPETQPEPLPETQPEPQPQRDER